MTALVLKIERDTRHIERFNHTLRQRLSHLVRKYLYSVKKNKNYIGAIK